MVTKDPASTLGFGLIHFIPSEEKVVAYHNTNFYDRNKKRIVMMTEKRVDTEKKHIGVMVMRKQSSMGLTRILNSLQGKV